MRVAMPGVTRAGAPFALSFEGREVEAWPGESLAAALLSAGIVGLRTTARGDPRGLWCGMGVCGECRVEVDGVVRRSCMTAAAPGQRVTRASGVAEAHGAAPRRSEHRSPDLLVVGAGPAGLSAARVAAAAGLTVLVADERGLAGGQYFKQPGKGFAIDEARLDAQAAEGRALTAAAWSAGAEPLAGATLWATALADDGAPELHFATDDAMVSVRPRRVVLAMGAYERPWAVPGWTLPGVMTSGAAQTLLRAYQTAPGRRVLVAGNGPLNLHVARELQRAGVEVVALVEQSPAPGIAQAASAARMAAASPGLVLDGVRQLAGLRRGSTPTFHEHVLIAVEGGDRAEAAVIGRVGRDGTIVPGSERRFAVDAVCLGYGFLPQAEAARALGCAFRARPGGGIEAVRGDDGRSSVPSVFIAGDGGGLGGARVAIAQGVAAGAAAVEDLLGALGHGSREILPGHGEVAARRADGGAGRGGAGFDRAAPPPHFARSPSPFRGGLAREREAALRALARHRRFQAALWALYAPRVPYLPVSDDRTLLCRCEGVPASAVDALLTDDIRDLGALKRASRTGMGACQGRYCGPLIAARLDPEGRSELPGFAPRPPFKPVPIAAIAALASKSGAE